MALRHLSRRLFWEKGWSTDPHPSNCLQDQAAAPQVSWLLLRGNKHPVSTHPVDTRSETQNEISSLIHRAIYYSFCTAVSYCLIGSTVKSRVDETCCWKSCVIEPWMAEGENFWAASVVVLWFIAIANVWKGQAFGTVLQSTQSSYKNIQE